MLRANHPVYGFAWWDSSAKMKKLRPKLMKELPDIAMKTLTDADLQAFLDESLPAAQMSEIELRLRDDRELHERLATLRGQQDAGLHGIGAIWRRHRVSCIDREKLGQYLLGVLDEAEEEYIRFHIDRVGCRFCESNLADLQSHANADRKQAEGRRRKYFQTSVGHLKKS
ncbi:MAG: hypothetical protein R3C05_16810 [Pirellulaceae bacterium]